MPHPGIIAFRHEVTDNVSLDIFAQAWSTALTTIAEACPNMQMSNPDNDCHEFVLRKAIIGEACRPLAAIDWKSVSLKQLQKWCPDKKNNFCYMPDLCGQDLSELLLGRPDHALLVSMWACLYGKVRVSRNTVRQALAQVDLADEVAEYIRGSMGCRRIRKT